MRFVSVLLLLAGLAFVTTAVLADPNNVEPKEWHFFLGSERTVYPECAPDPGCNDTCTTAQGMAIDDLINPAYLDAGNLDWYTWEANAGDCLNMGTDAYIPGDCTDTYIELYASDCTTLLAGDDDSGPCLYSLIQNFTAPYTGRYNLKVRGYSGSSYGEYLFFVSRCGGGLPNDRCEGAIDIPRCSAGTVNGDTYGARNDYDPGSGGCSSGYPEAGKDVVYVMNLLAGDVVDMTYTQLQYDTAFYVVTDCSNVAGTCIVGADDTYTGEPEVIHFVAPADDAYFVILDAYGTDSGGPWTMDYNIYCPAPEACCFDDASCLDLLRDECLRLGGTPQGAGTDCAHVQCPFVPVNSTTWGQIKSSYR